MNAYRPPPSPIVYNVMAFGVEQEAEGFLPQNFKSVALPPLPSLIRLDFGPLQQEPAITGFDWLFTPSHRS